MQYFLCRKTTNYFAQNQRFLDFYFQSWPIFTSKVGWFLLPKLAKLNQVFLQIKTDSKLDGNTCLHHIVIEWRPTVFGLGTMISYSAIRMLDLPIAARKQ